MLRELPSYPFRTKMLTLPVAEDTVLLWKMLLAAESCFTKVMPPFPRAAFIWWLVNVEVLAPWPYLEAVWRPLKLQSSPWCYVCIWSRLSFCPMPLSSLAFYRCFSESTSYWTFCMLNFISGSAFWRIQPATTLTTEMLELWSCKLTSCSSVFSFLKWG